MDEIHLGGCQSGAPRYPTRGQPVKTAVRHRRYSQKCTGSAFGLSAYFAADMVDVRQGARRDYCVDTECRRYFTTKFFPTCGTSVFWRLEMSPHLIGIAGGTFDPPTFWFPVQRDIFTRSAAPFVHTDIADKYDTTESYAPVRPDSPALQGA